MQFYSFLSLGLLLLPFGSCRPGKTEDLQSIHTAGIEAAQAIDEDTAHETITTRSFITSSLMTTPAATGSGVPIDYQAINSDYNLTLSIPALSTGLSVMLTTGPTPTTSISTTVRPTHSEAEVDGLDYYVDWSDIESDFEDDYYTDDDGEDEEHGAGAVGAAPCY